MSRRHTQDDTARVPRARSGTAGRRERTGTEPVTARSALKLRLVLSVAGLPVFVLGTVVFAVWAGAVGRQDVPDPTQLTVLAVICGVLALFAAADLVVVLLRLARERAGHTPRRDA
ncbi:hypothetical protein D0Z67_02920 [Streptomyces seoulensis]|uniref:Uncharacterized protein n=1 Tax=Streptomyces seoulensis TaxID=73044 RepID=A0A4P6TS54_STRSO|nr:DUF6343 family protein [Streptomyces seoulensis]QBJ89364.1 hypothetical protein D0Z67_02920 [Streptomyces seoulensis]